MPVFPDLKKISRDLASLLAFCVVVETGIVLVAVLPYGWPGWSRLLEQFFIGYTYACVIGGLAWFSTPPLASRVWNWPALQRWSAILGGLLVSAFAGTVAGTAVLAGLYSFLPARHLGDFSQVFGQALRTAVPVTLIVGVTVTLLESARIRLADTETALTRQRFEREQAEKFAAQARFEALTARVEPHFLFNTLNSIAALIREEPAQAEITLERLSSLLRGSLEQAETIPLEQEMRLVRDYLEIQRTRLGPRLTYQLDYDIEARNSWTVPPFAVQTLAENAIKHVAGARTDGVVLRISAASSAGNLVLNVTDDGPGFDSGALKSGHGLDMLAARIRALYGPSAELRLERGEDTMTVCLTLPARSSASREPLK